MSIHNKLTIEEAIQNLGISYLEAIELVRKGDLPAWTDFGKRVDLSDSPLHLPSMPQSNSNTQASKEILNA